MSGFTLNSLLSQFSNLLLHQEKLQKHTSITLRWCTWTNLLTCIPVHAHETGVLAVPPIAWLTGPSKNGADINRLGRSHVSVYTGRPRSSTTRALDSLCTANLHTIHLCLIQKHFIRTQHTRGMCMHIQHICASMQKCSHSHLRHVKIQMLQAHMAWLFLSPTQYCGCLISFPLRLSFRAFSSSSYRTSSFSANWQSFSSLTEFPQTHQTSVELSFTTLQHRLSKALTSLSKSFWNGPVMYAQHKQNTGVLTNTSSLQAAVRSPQQSIRRPGRLKVLKEMASSHLAFLGNCSGKVTLF